MCYIKGREGIREVILKKADTIMVQKIFGFSFGIKTLKPKHIDTGYEVKPKTPMNIPTADDILEFSYPDESPFKGYISQETHIRS